MRQRARQVTDREIISAMLDEMDTLHLALHDAPFPYVVPLNFGYEWQDESLVFYFHCAKEGYKLRLLARDPNVCVSASRFISYAQGSVKGHLHDYRCVIARGVAENIDPRQDAQGFEHAHRLLLAHNRRDAQDVHSTAMQHIMLWRILCRAQDVTAKAEIVPHSVQEVAFAPAKADGVPLDESHIPGIKK